ncbi:MAG: response regulator [Acidobacteriota bacterium]
MDPARQRVEGANILVVDDEHRNVRLMESILRAAGFTVLKAHDGEEALRLIDERRPDALLLDVMMPGLSGLDVCRRLRARHETRLLPIIMVTALNALEDKVQALEAGADDFLSKPVNKAELNAKVRSILRVKALQDEVERQRSELEAANRELLRMQRFKESMTQMVVHDLKNPLTGIMGNLQLIQMQGVEMGRERLREVVRRSQDAGRQLMRMILNILQIGKLEENKITIRREPLRLMAVVAENIEEMISLGARDGIRLENRVDPDLPPLAADRELLGRVIGNLLSNALKHTGRGGRVIVDAHVEGDEIVLSVSDTGEGIPDELLPAIFDKFVSGGDGGGRRLPHDSGLGLTFCKLAVEAHGGRIRVQSHRGRGTTVCVALPLRGARAVGGTAPGADVPAA